MLKSGGEDARQIRLSVLWTMVSVYVWSVTTLYCVMDHRVRAIETNHEILFVIPIARKSHYITTALYCDS